MAKREEETPKLEYSTFYRLIHRESHSVWSQGDNSKCNFHTPDEIKLLYEIEKNHPEWRVEKSNYPIPITI